MQRIDSDSCHYVATSRDLPQVSLVNDWLQLLWPHKLVHYVILCKKYCVHSTLTEYTVFASLV